MRIAELRRAETWRLLRAVMCAFAASCLIGALLAPDFSGIFTGFWGIITHPAQLTRDYFSPELGGVSGAMLNAALVGALCCALMFLPGAKVTGTTVLGFFLTLGFSFYGINLLNMLPMALGVFAYSKIRRQPFGRNIHFVMFSGGLAPLISEALFRYPNADALHGIAPSGVALALLIGMAAGCCMPALCAHSQAFHKGYDLYNAGPAAGFLCFAIYSVLYRTFGFEPPAVTSILGGGHRAFANAFCGALFAACAICGLALNRGPGDYAALLTDSGYRSDFTQKYSAGANLLNLGLYGLFILLYYNLIGATFTGVTMGVVFCMLCCGCNGATVLNVLPVLTGYGVMGLLNRAGVTALPINGQGLVVAACFASGLAPISGEYGALAGVVGGVLHYCMVTGVPALHGGFNLYNGGFAAGIVCFVYVPVLEHFFLSRAQRHARRRPRG